MLELRIKKQFPDIQIEVDLQLPTQGITMLFGRSGAGKSSLLNMIAGLSHIDQGYICLQNNRLVDTAQQINLPIEQRHIGYVFQEARLFPHYRVKGNLTYGMKSFSKEKFNAIVELLGLSQLLNRYPITLSGGEKQRVAIGRALLSEPKLLLMDEPLSALDIPRKQELMRYLQRLVQEIDIPILYVTHSLDELKTLADRVVLLENGKVAAFSDIETIWNSGVLREWQREQAKQWLFPATVTANKENLVCVELAQQPLAIPTISKIDVGCSVKCLISQRDLVLSPQPIANSSIPYCLQGTIQTIKTNSAGSTVIVCLSDDMVIDIPVKQQLSSIFVAQQMVYIYLLDIQILLK
ncbi:molybdenum ABC transporter ATP-binding protein [Gallibacterium anatis]|uniref:Molybdenum ABC transporter ATP-binding protein n=1 Tax=Gallibacterium anatis 4895 TaxID=1396510 RepID=A0A0A2ZVM7_9PAST|nr:molybdenum ABC transporter ATP-binding protein [Gallibacterium anatis]KGQ41141.1 molybdenum ABC transporter ATP-binding protein [Gallibacterium anatis]KGQ45969.1 molybdenum ABC transporter ATP-binding protein [Gallibacterium anatis]KGQ61098.1 molybdenum ABC transporter ATP-binding protein [Gallibacterium anatis 4895]KGQ67282.1 molybdenum ABC transporter ATP-binding protein [Gallibacterium anatis]KGQ68813.1 molybdenum ABC transporter ATP-binding protein [Gallibacterium anatis]